jgi:hypothetical protein
MSTVDSYDTAVATIADVVGTNSTSPGFAEQFPGVHCKILSGSGRGSSSLVRPLQNGATMSHRSIKQNCPTEYGLRLRCHQTLSLNMF